jgi:hypothetical protein
MAHPFDILSEIVEAIFKIQSRTRNRKENIVIIGPF